MSDTLRLLLIGLGIAVLVVVLVPLVIAFQHRPSHHDDHPNER